MVLHLTFDVCVCVNVTIASMVTQTQTQTQNGSECLLCINLCIAIDKMLDLGHGNPNAADKCEQGSNTWLPMYFVLQFSIAWVVIIIVC